MIQRKQTLFLLAAVILSVVCLSMPIGWFISWDLMGSAKEYNLWIAKESGERLFSSWPLFAVLLSSAALGLVTIFYYHNRIAQARLCQFNMLLIVGWYVIYAVFSRLLLEGEMIFRPTLQAFLPALALALYFMAYKAIWADEKLVRAADRIR